MIKENGHRASVSILFLYLVVKKILFQDGQYLFEFMLINVSKLSSETVEVVV